MYATKLIDMELLRPLIAAIRRAEVTLERHEREVVGLELYLAATHRELG